MFLFVGTHRTAYIADSKKKNEEKKEEEKQLITSSFCTLGKSSLERMNHCISV